MLAAPPFCLRRSCASTARLKIAPHHATKDRALKFLTQTVTSPRVQAARPRGTFYGIAIGRNVMRRIWIGAAAAAPS